MFSRIVVAGTGEPGASVSVAVLLGTQQLGVASGTVRATGEFTVEVVYSGPEDTTPLTVSVTLSNEAGEYMAPPPPRPRGVQAGAVPLASTRQSTVPVEIPGSLVPRFIPPVRLPQPIPAHCGTGGSRSRPCLTSTD